MAYPALHTSSPVAATLDPVALVVLRNQTHRLDVLAHRLAETRADVADLRRLLAGVMDWAAGCQDGPLEVTR